MNAIVCDCCGATVTGSSRFCSAIITSTRFANEHFDLCPKCADAIRAVAIGQAIVMDRKNGIVIPLRVESEE